MRDWLAQIGATVAAAFRWWVGELAGLVPGWLRQQFSGARRRLILIIEDDVATLVFEAGEGTKVLRRFAVAAGHMTEVQRFSSPTARGGRSAEHVAIRLPADRALRSEMVLPLAATRNLDQVIAFEFERHTPFRREDVYFTHRIVKRDAALRQLLIELTSVPRAVVQEAVQLAQQIGLRVEGVEVAGVGGVLAVSPNLLPDQQRPAKKRIGNLALGGAAALAVVLAIAAVAIPLIEATTTANTLSRQIDEAKRQAEASAQLQKDIDAELRDSNFLIARKRQTPAVTELLETLTRVIPDDTWVTDLRITATSVQLTGYATSATTVLGLLDRAAGFSDAAFGASVTQDPGLNREQFDITAKIVPRTDR